MRPRYDVKLVGPAGPSRIEAGLLIDAWIRVLCAEPLGLDPEVVAALAASTPEDDEGDWMRSLRAAAKRELEGDQP